jgi:RNA polymerase sigma-70 factor (ECF subfamily)
MQPGFPSVSPPDFAFGKRVLRHDAPKSEQPTVERDPGFTARMDEARAGSREALGQLIDSCRAYLLLVANEELDPSLRAKVAASDLVQETLLAAQAEFPQFRGQSEPELLKWLRRTLLNDLADLRRKYQHSDKRAIAREEPLAGDSRADRLLMDLPANGLTPRASSIAREEAAALQQAMARLPDDYRQAVTLRNWERMSFTEIAEQMNRSPEAVRKLWTRAVERLRDELSALHGESPR